MHGGGQMVVSSIIIAAGDDEAVVECDFPDLWELAGSHPEACDRGGAAVSSGLSACDFNG